jgi:2'-5' RNA ligase
MRLFISIDIPDEIKEYLSRVKDKLRENISEEDMIRWVNTRNMHLTIKFLGEVSENKLEDIKERLRTVNGKKMQLSLSHIGGFPENNQIRVVWVGVKEEEQLSEMHKLVDFSMSKQFLPEKDFKGHMTLGRVKHVRNAESLLRQIKKEKIESHKFNAEKFALVQSKLTPKGPEYTVIEEYMLY